jgi:hypothetical protein
MKCQNCSNELGPNEIFCGQCGAQNAVPAQQTEMIPQAPVSPAPIQRSGILGNSYRSNSFPSSQPGQPFVTEMPSQSAIPQGPQQAGGFYQDATEAFSSIPGTHANYSSAAYPQQGMPGGGPMPSGFPSPGQFGVPQQPPFPSGNFGNPNMTFPPTQMGFSNSQFGYRPGSGTGLPVQPQQERKNVLIIVGVVCLVVAVVLVGTFGTLFALHGGGGNNTQAQATVAPTATSTEAPSPTALPTPSPTPTVAATPTPIPDTGYSWCTQCTPYGFQVEYPDGWTSGLSQDGNGVEFTSPDPNVFSTFRSPSGSWSSNDQLIQADKSTFQQIRNVSLTPLSSSDQMMKIGGQLWDYQSFLYQGKVNGQPAPIKVNIYATLYQNKGYVIELVTPQSSFPDAHFSTMLNSFQFVTPT